MARILIVFSSDHDGTGKMARALAQGVESVEGCSAKLMQAEEAKAEDVLAADALVLGTPVHMGSMDWRMKKFIDTQCGGLWMGDKVIGKVGAVFACGSGYGGAGSGAELTLLAMLNNLAELGMILVPLPKNAPNYQQSGLQWGAYGRAHNEDLSPIDGGLPDERTQPSRAHGVHIARLASALSGQKIFD
ncbi:MAG: NAD(P)H-dependent oxidoreductase [Desulfarculaceae bacterium]|nr:NAD(P)H-dependent oxidoreductase [Desulfarculaceae bacterium]MCF8073420.1 NAD(P)H-dependent oxidoreductase [Desulfarculaceae bacterium]MCF8100433.1 NAD(P)H-dependent oxidoreductase [Desulfarculaceae bacterium]MCF8115831.1 NAD(P)H-dependent oxidoreductase [Desulfarculaceae bacterium]